LYLYLAIVSASLNLQKNHLSQIISYQTYGN